MSLPPAQPSTNLQPQRSPVDPGAALQAQQEARQQQQAQMMQLVMAMIMKMMQGGGMGGQQGQPGADSLSAPLGGPPPAAMPFQGASASPDAPPVPGPRANG